MEYTDPEDSEEELFYEDEGELVEVDDEDKLEFMEKSLQDYEDNIENIRKRRKVTEEGGEVQLEEVIEESMKKEEASRWFQRREFSELENFSKLIEKDKAGFEDEDEYQNESKKEKKKRLKKVRQTKYNQEKVKSEKDDFQTVPQEYPEVLDEEALAETIALGTAMLR